ncbi:MAG: type II secretion system GspH family protein [Omnitrophica bacterium]|nr:type II secretion system GspH family protein [Candidatus Omnitrophota bacterium]
MIKNRSSAFTLIEIIMAMAILAVGIIGIVRLLPVGLRASKSSEMMSRAGFLAQEKMEELKLAGFEQLLAPEEPLEGEVGDYTWMASVSEVALKGLASSEDIRSLRLTVTWQEKGKTRSQDFVTYIRK